LIIDYNSGNKENINANALILSGMQGFSNRDSFYQTGEGTEIAQISFML